MNQRQERWDFQDNSFCKKEEAEYSNYSQFFIMKQEEMTDNRFTISPHSESNLNFIANKVDCRVDRLVQEVEQYLDTFVDVEDFQIESNLLPDCENEMLVSKVKAQFKESGAEIVKSLGEHLKKQSIQHTVPESYLSQLTETTKQRIFSSYKQLKRNLTEAISSHKSCIKQELIKKEENASIPLRKMSKKKLGFPKEARAMLKAWFNANIQDPYPSHEEKIYLAREGGITIKQLDNWLTNTRGRKWKQIKQDEKNFGSEVEYLFLMKHQCSAPLEDDK